MYLYRNLKFCCVVLLLASIPADAGWWISSDGTHWCHKVGPSKYCLPEDYTLERIEGEDLNFAARHKVLPAKFARYLGDKEVDVLVDSLTEPQGVTVQSDSMADGLRMIRLKGSEEQHNIVIALVVFPDNSIVQLLAPDENQLEQTIRYLANAAEIE